MGKRGVSAIVATVLMLLVVVVAIVLIWTLVAPPFRAKMAMEQMCYKSSLEIDASKNFTCYDPVSDAIRVRVDRSKSEVHVVKAQFIFSKDGNTRRLSKYFSGKDNPVEVFYFVIDGEADKISVAPVVEYGKSELVCDVTSTKVGVRNCDINHTTTAVEDEFVAYWKFDDNLTDVDERLDGVFVGGTPVYEAGRNGIGRSLRLDGVDDRVLINNAHPLNITDEITVGGWVRSFSDSYSFIFWSGDASYYIALIPSMISGSTRLRFVFYDGDEPTTPNWPSAYADINLGEWYHVVGTFKANEYLKIYLNGELIETETNITAPSFTNETMIIGRVGWWSAWLPNQWFDGNVDEIFVLHRAMEDWEVKELYEFQRF